MNEGRSPINIFTLGDTNNHLNEPMYNIYNGSTGQATINNMVPEESTSNTMANLDNQLRNEGFKIDNQMSRIEKQNYVDGLTSENYQKMLQYKNAGYSFEASKALLESSQRAGAGGYRGEGFALNEPLGGENSAWNIANFPGYLMEKLDNAIQSIPDLDIREMRKRKLREKVDNLSKEEQQKYIDEFSKSSTLQALYKNPYEYALHKNSDLIDNMFDAWNEENVGPNFGVMASNIPGSAIKTASAIGRGITNPVDMGYMLAELVGTKEGRDVLKQRYGTIEGLTEAIEKDPVGVASDILAVGEVGAGAVGWTAKGAGTVSRLGGLTSTAERLNKFGNTALNTSRTMGGASDLGLGVPYEKGLNALTNKLGEGGRWSQRLGAYISMTQRPIRTIWNGASPNGSNTVLPGVSGAVGRVIDSMKDRIQTSATGLTPEVRERIRQNPYIKEYRDRIETMLKDEGAPMDNQKIMELPIEEVGQELLRRLEEYENRLDIDGAEYQRLRATTMPYNLSSFMAGVYDVLGKNGISLTPEGGLNFSRTANPADMNPIITAWNVIRNMEPQLQSMTISQILDFRQQLRSLIKYHSDAPSTKYSKGVIRQLVDGEFNKLVHKEIPELKKVDNIYKKEIDELAKIKDGIVYQVGEKKGQIKDNFYSILSTLNTQNRQKMKGRLEEKIFPGIGDRIEAIRMLPTIAKAVQSSPQMMKALFQRAGFLGGISQSGGVKKAIVGWLLGIVADELFAKPLGEKRREKAINELMNEVSPEAMEKLAYIKSKIDAGVELSEQDKRDLQTAIQDIAQKEYKYLDEQHKKEFDKIMESANNTQPKLPGTMDVIGPDGKVRLSAGKQVNNPENYKPKPRNRKEKVQQIEQEHGVDTDTAEQMVNTVDDFLREIGADTDGNIKERKVDYEKFSTKSLNELMENDIIPRTEKDKIKKILLNRTTEAEAGDRAELDKEYAYKIKKLEEEEQRVGKIGRNKVSRDIAQKQQNAVDDKRDKLKEEMRGRYAGIGVALDQNRGEDKFMELSQKSVDFANSYKKTTAYRTETAEREVLDKLMEGWSKQPKFVREMDDNLASVRKGFLDKVNLENGYKIESTDYNDRYINDQTGDKGAIKYDENGKIQVVVTSLDGFLESGILDSLPDDAEIKVAGEDLRANAGDFKNDGSLKRVSMDNRGTPTSYKPGEMVELKGEGYQVEKFSGELTPEQKQRGLDLYEKAKGWNRADRQEFIIMSQVPGYIEALGLDKNEVASRIAERGFISSDEQSFLKRLHKGVDRAENQYSGLYNILYNQGDVRNIDGLNMLVKSVLGEDNGTAGYQKEARELVDTILIVDAHLDQRLLDVELLNREGWREGGVKVTGEYSAKRDLLRVGKQYEKTVSHEIVHYDDSLIGRELMQSDGEERRATRRYDDAKYLSDDAKKLHEKILKFVDDLYKCTSEAQRTDKTIINGKPGSEYRTDPREMWARFGESFVEKMKDIKETGLFKKEDFYNEAGDTYGYKLIKDFVDILQEHQRLSNEGGHFYEPITPTKGEPESVSKVQQQSLFDQEPEISKEEAEAEFKKEYLKLYNILDRATRSTAKYPDTLTDSLNKTYTPDLKEWLRRIVEDDIEDRKGKFNGETIIDIYYAFKKLADNPKAMQFLKSEIDNNKFHRTPYYNLMQKMKAQPLKIPEEFKNEQWLGPLRRALYEIDGTSLDDLQRYYDPDIVQWMDNLIYHTHSGITMAELRNIDKLLDDYFKNADTNVEVKGTFADDAINSLVEARVNREKHGWKSPITTYDWKQILKVGKETEEILTKRLEQTDLYYEHINPDREGFEEEDRIMARDKADQLADEYEDFKEQFTYVLGDTYDPNVDKWHNNIKKWLKDNLDKFEGFRGVSAKQRGDFVYPHQLNSLKAKIKELDKYSRQDIQSVYGGTYTDAFMRAVKPRIEELQAKGMDKTVSDLIALSDMSVENFKKQINRGGKIPMPSIAVQDPNVPSGAFGDLTVIFGKDTVDPKADKRNVLYGSDAWTPMFPDVKKVDGINVKNILELQENLEDIIKRDDRFSTIAKRNIWSLANKTADEIYKLSQTKNDFDDDLRGYGYLGIGNGFRNSGLKSWYDNNVKNPALDPLINDMIMAIVDFVDDHKSELVIPARYFGLGAKDRPLTPENVLEAMRGEGTRRTTYPGTFRDMIEIEGTRVDSLEDVRKRNFAKVFHGDWTGEFGDLETRYARMMSLIAEEFVPYTEKEATIPVVERAIKKAYDTDVDKFQKNMMEAYNFTEEIPKDVLQRVIDIVEQGRKIPIRFSESKPDRIVDMYEEIQYVLVPEERLEEVKETVAGTPLEGKIEGYKPDDYSAPRSEKIKELQKKNGNIFFSMGGVVMPIAMLYLMMQQEEEGQA